MKVSRNFYVGSILIAMCSLLITGCAGTKVQDVSSIQDSTLIAPKTIAVLTEVKLKYPPRHETLNTQNQAAEEIQEALDKQMKEILISHNLNVVNSNNHPDLLLINRIIDIRKGKRALRLFVGYGAGRAELEVVTSVVKPTQSGQTSLLSFKTKSTTGGMPSGLIGGLIKSLKQDGLQIEASDTVKKIDDELSDYFSSQGWNYDKVNTH